MLVEVCVCVRSESGECTLKVLIEVCITLKISILYHVFELPVFVNREDVWKTQEEIESRADFAPAWDLQKVSSACFSQCNYEKHLLLLLWNKNNGAKQEFKTNSLIFPITCVDDWFANSL